MDRYLSQHINQRGVAKAKYSEADARARAKIEQARNGSQRRPYNAYECGHCGAWHIGRRPVRPSVRRNGRRKRGD